MTRVHLSNEGRAPFIGGDLFGAGPALPPDVGWCPCLGRLDSASGPNGYVGIAKYDLAWARRMTWCVPIGHTGLVMEDDESTQRGDLYMLNKVKREAAIDLQRAQQNALMQAIPRAMVGPYAGPAAGHQWPPAEYLDESYSWGRLGELINRTEVIYPLCYLLGPNSSRELHHYDNLMRMAVAARTEYGKPIACVVSPTVWDGAGGPLAYADTYEDLDSFRSVIECVLKWQPEHIVLWHSQIYIQSERAIKASGAALTPSEAATVRSGAIAEIYRHLDIIRECAKESQPA